MTLTNAPTNALATLQTPCETPMQTTPQTQQTPHQTTYTQTPYNPQGVCKPLTRAFYPPANTAALALRSRSQALDRPDHQTIAKQDCRSPARQTQRGTDRIGSRKPPRQPDSNANSENSARPLNTRTDSQNQGHAELTGYGKGSKMEGRNSPHQRQACVDIQPRVFSNIGARPSPGRAERVSQRVFLLARCL
jgi:hypothetical protein